MTLETRPFDAAQLLRDEETIGYYLDDMFADGDPSLMAKAIGDVARARMNMAQLARDTGMTRTALYRSFSKDGNPTIASMVAALKALGFQLTVKPIKTESV